MLTKIHLFIQSLTESNSKDNENAISLEIACTVLLCEVMRADGHFTESEQRTLHQLICAHFSLTSGEVNDIIKQALEYSEQAIDFFKFTSMVNSHYNIEQRMEIVKLLWKIAYADGELASIEEHTIRRIADLLHLRHSEYIATKKPYISSNK